MALWVGGSGPTAEVISRSNSSHEVQLTPVVSDCLVLVFTSPSLEYGERELCTVLVHIEALHRCQETHHHVGGLIPLFWHVGICLMYD